MMPKIKFRFSYIYDRSYRENQEVRDHLRSIKKPYPSLEEIFRFMEQIEIKWKKEGERILKKISKELGIKWNNEEIPCYIVGVCRPISDPLTIRYSNNIDYGVDMITHELIHRAQGKAGKERWSRWEKYLNSKHPKINARTKNHILVHALHKKIYLDLFDKTRLEDDIKLAKKNPEYRQAWEIVEKEGHDNIIRKFNELTK